MVIKNGRNITKDCRFMLYDSIPLGFADKQLLGNVFFKYDHYNLTRQGKKTMNYVMAFLKAHPQIRLYVTSHTDSRGTSEYNIKLSEKRLDVCLKYLYKKGVNSNKIVGESYGEDQIFNHCKDGVDCSPEEHLINRRTQFSVLIK